MKQQELITSNSIQNKQKYLWNTTEFYFYYVYIAFALYYWLYRAFKFSRSDTPFYEIYASTLSDGWFLGLKLDNTDEQYKGFRRNLPWLGSLLMGYIGVGYVLMIRNPGKSGLKSRLWYDLICSMIFLMISYGSSCIWIAIIVLINYCIGLWTSSTILNPILTWMFALTILISNEYFQGYRFNRILPIWSILDRYRGMTYAHGISWHLVFPITVLRAISFNMDYYWFFNRKRYKDLHMKHKVNCLECDESQLTRCERMKIEQPRHFEDYNLISYIVYLFYIPLYFAGPIMNFNSFMTHCEQRVLSLNRDWKYIIVYGFRLINAMFIMEVMNHLFHSNAISKQHLWNYLKPIDLMVMSYLLLKHVWLKLLIIWRFFRLFAMLDGLKPLENMDRCMSNNYSGLEFWKSWHRSYNRWLVRYLYIPLGGSKWRAVNMWIIFSFVALWHDASLNLLIWSWMICVLALPEILCRFIFLREPYIRWPCFRHLCALAAAFNIFAMMAANLTGFAFGVEGLTHLVKQLTSGISGFISLVISIVGFFAAVQIMFEIRKKPT